MPFSIFFTASTWPRDLLSCPWWGSFIRVSPPYHLLPSYSFSSSSSHSSRSSLSIVLPSPTHLYLLIYLSNLVLFHHHHRPICVPSSRTNTPLRSARPRPSVSARNTRIAFRYVYIRFPLVFPSRCARRRRRMMRCLNTVACLEDSWPACFQFRGDSDMRCR